jgi:hypothetical protein
MPPDPLPASIGPAASNFWLLRLVPSTAQGRWISGAVIFVLVFGVFATLGGVFDEKAEARIDTSVALFFATLLAYIIPIHHLIMQRSLAAWDQLRVHLPQDGELLAAYRQRILNKPLWWQVAILLAGLAAGLVHNALLLDGDELRLALTSPATLLSLLVTLVIWVIMTATISSLVENAILFKRLAGQVRIQVLDTHALTPFGSVAVSSTLALIGAQAAFPLLIAASDSQWITFVPGLIATGVPMVFLFLLPVIPVHRRIVGLKRATLERIGGKISACTTGDTPDYQALEPLLVYRREVLEAPEWPFDTTVIGRLALYLIIPPLTWIGAALIEILVDTAI